MSAFDVEFYASLVKSIGHRIANGPHRILQSPSGQRSAEPGQIILDANIGVPQHGYQGSGDIVVDNLIRYGCLRRGLKVQLSDRCPGGGSFPQKTMREPEGEMR